MNSIIENLYYGKITALIEEAEKTEEYKELVKGLLKYEDELLKKFPECRELYNKCSDARCDISLITNFNRFALGFRIGSQLALEMLKPIK